MAETAQQHKLVTQMGTQIHAGNNYRRAVELIQGGAIGPVHEVHVWLGADFSGPAVPATASQPDTPTDTPPVPATPRLGSLDRASPAPTVPFSVRTVCPGDTGGRSPTANSAISSATICDLALLGLEVAAPDDGPGPRAASHIQESTAPMDDCPTGVSRHATGMPPVHAPFGTTAAGYPSLVRGGKIPHVGRAPCCSLAAKGCSFPIMTDTNCSPKTSTPTSGRPDPFLSPTRSVTILEWAVGVQDGRNDDLQFQLFRRTDGSGTFMQRRIADRQDDYLGRREPHGSRLPRGGSVYSAQLGEGWTL